MSLQHVAELIARHITEWLRRFRHGEITTAEITDEATSRFADDVAEAMGPTVPAAVQLVWRPRVGACALPCI